MPLIKLFFFVRWWDQIHDRLKLQSWKIAAFVIQLNISAKSSKKRKTKGRRGSFSAPAIQPPVATFINPVQPRMPASTLQHNCHLHTHISNAIRAWKEHLWKLKGINSKTRMHFTIVVVNLHKCSCKNICSHKWRSTFRRKHGWKFSFQQAATEYKTAEAGVRVSTSQRNKLVSLFNIWNVSVRL